MWNGAQKKPLWELGIRNLGLRNALEGKFEQGILNWEMGFVVIRNRGFRVAEQAGAGGVGVVSGFALRLFLHIGRAFDATRDAEFQMGKYGGAKAGLSWLREWSAVRWPTECAASGIAACCVGSCSVLRFSPWKGGCGQAGRRGGSPYTMADPLQASPAPA